MNKRFHITYLAIIAFIFCLFIAAFLFTPVLLEDLSSTSIEPVSINQSEKYEREFIFNVSDIDVYKTGIAFFFKASIYKSVQR